MAGVIQMGVEAGIQRSIDPEPRVLCGTGRPAGQAECHEAAWQDGDGVGVESRQWTSTAQNRHNFEGSDQGEFLVHESGAYG